MTTETIETTETAASTIVAQMSEDDREAFNRDDWREGVSLMLHGAWSHLDEDGVLDAIEELLEPELEQPCQACAGTGIEHYVPHQGTLACDPARVEERECPVCDGTGMIF